MARVRQWLQGLLWGIYRLCGLACLGLAAQLALLIAEFETAQVARADQWPYLAACLALLCGGLLVLPSTTPIWLRRIRSLMSAGLSILSILGLCAVVLSGATLIVTARAADLIAVSLGIITQSIGVFAVIAVLCIGTLGLTAPRDRPRRVPLMQTAATHCGQLPQLPSASRYS